FERQGQFLIAPRQQFVDGVLDQVIRHDAVARGLVVAHRHVIAHERHVRLQLGIGQRQDRTWPRGVSVVAARRFLADELSPSPSMGVGQKLRGRGEGIAVDQDVDLAGEGRLARLLRAPVGVLHHPVLPVGLALEHVRRQRPLLVRVLPEREVHAVEDQVVVILKRLVDQNESKSLPGSSAPPPLSRRSMMSAVLFLLANSVKDSRKKTFSSFLLAVPPKRLIFRSAILPSSKNVSVADSFGRGSSSLAASMPCSRTVCFRFCWTPKKVMVWGLSRPRRSMRGVVKLEPPMRRIRAVCTSPSAGMAVSIVCTIWSAARPLTARISWPASAPWALDRSRRT